MTTFNENIQMLLLGALYTVTSVGVYGIAKQINIFGHMIHIAVMTTARPIVAELFDRGDRDQMRRLYQTTTKWTFTANLPLFLILCVFPAQILSVFGESFAQGAPALILLAAASMVDVSTGMCGAILDMTGHTRLKLINNIVRLLLAVGVSMFLIPRWGPIGAATAAFVVVLITNLLRVLQVLFLFRLQPYNSSYAKPLAAGAIALVTAVLVGSLVGDVPTLPVVAGQSMLLVVVYIGMILGLGLSGEDRQILAHLRRRLGTRLTRKRAR
jgi:O-antigen/teichoic acid export membrane protein